MSPLILQHPTQTIDQGPIVIIHVGGGGGRGIGQKLSIPHNKQEKIIYGRFAPPYHGRKGKERKGEQMALAQSHDGSQAILDVEKQCTLLNSNGVHNSETYLCTPEAVRWVGTGKTSGAKIAACVLFVVVHTCIGYIPGKSEHWSVCA